MTTEQLRKLIKVTDWSLNENGLTVSYEREDHNPKLLHFILNPLEAYKELSIVGNMEGINYQSSLGSTATEWYHYQNLFPNYKMCQWEALSIAVRHEATKELSNDMNMLELDETINALR